MSAGGSRINKNKHFLLTLFSFISYYFFLNRNYLILKHNYVKRFHKTFFYANLQKIYLNSLLQEFHLEDVAANANCIKGMTHAAKQALRKSGLLQKPKGWNAGKVNRKEMNLLAFSLSSWEELAEKKKLTKVIIHWKWAGLLLKEEANTHKTIPDCFSHPITLWVKNCT